METFRVHILGCGSALPTLKHNSSSQVIEIRDKLFMIDCGEGTQMQLRRSRLRFTKINTVLISHLHGDHCFGLIGMISTFGLLGRTAPLHIYAPKELEEILKLEISFFCTGLEYEIVFHNIDTTTANIIYEDKSLTITTIPLCHRKPCCGFLFQEKQLLPHLRRDVLDAYQISISQINNIKHGADGIAADGTVIPNARLIKPASPSRSYAYCSDTRYMPGLYKMLQNIDLLYHESTYLDADADKAALYNHSTAKEAAKVAKDANAKKLMLGHFSSRYDDENMLLDEAQLIFKNTVLADEMKVFDV